MAQPTTIACSVCRTPFISTDARRKFCTPACKQQARAAYYTPTPKLTLVCRCGTVFTQEAAGHTRHCSKRCGRDEANDLRRARRQGKLEQRPKLACRCGTVFTPRDDHHAFCSTDCRTGSKRRTDREPICLLCGEAIVGRKPQALYCSKRCNDVAHHERVRAERRAARGQRDCLTCGQPLDEEARLTMLHHPACRKQRNLASLAKYKAPPKAKQVVQLKGYLARLVDRHKPCRKCGELTMPRSNKPLLCIDCRPDEGPTIEQKRDWVRAAKWGQGGWDGSVFDLLIR